MASDGTSAKNRPLSPHLMDGMRFHWRWGPGMLSSILHRVTGVGATVGIFIALWWLGALVSGPASYVSFRHWMWADLSHLQWSGFAAIVGSLVRILLKVVLVGVSWSVIAHTITGIRHFVLDTGAGYELSRNNFWATVSTLLGFVLTAGFWALLLLR